MTAESLPVSIAYVGGSPRSGSTVLSHLVAATFNGVAIGELKDIWHRGPLENQRCSCGSPFRSCEFWTEVGREAFGGWDAVPLERLTALQRRIDRFRTLPLLLVSPLAKHCDPEFSNAVLEYRETLAVLYRALQHISGRRLIVESSKHPGQAFVLGASSEFHPRVIHLVRDSRGVAWSFQKQVVRPEITEGRKLMPQAAPTRSAWQWTLNNLPLHFLRARHVPRLVVQYESYARHPVEELKRIGSFLGLSDALSLSYSSSKLRLDFAAEHSLGGNPLRFSRAPLDLQVDEEWRIVMSRADRLRVGVLTLPLLVAYGYLGKSHAGR